MRTPDAHIGGPIEARFDGEKEEGACGYGAFAALTETAEAEWSRLLPTWWSWGESNPCPKITWQELLRAQFVISIPSAAREQTRLRPW